MDVENDLDGAASAFVDPVDGVGGEGCGTALDRADVHELTRLHPAPDLRGDDSERVVALAVLL